MNERVATLTMSVSEAAQELGISARRVYDLVHVAGFPALWLGHRVRVSREGLTEWVKANAGSGVVDF